ncbi:tyrosine recombinase XerC [Aestuariibacter salexigens]|uniref:tyrosine recombinase XerC n=1 Tax=Aestuariibacter salexigens TaxID=226010 RepID=UPI00041AE5A9|nr:tyrosine recombinase XerC [Aestuariibacter salexigens]
MSNDALNAWIARYIEYLRVERNLAAKTRESYQRQLDAITLQLSISSWQQLTVEHVRHILASARRQSLSPRSISLRLSALRSFCQYLIQHQQLQHNPASSVSAPKTGKPLPKQLNVDETQQLLNFDPQDPLAIRDKAMLELLYGCGLRLSELTGLNTNDILSDQQLRVLGKGSKQRLIPIGRKAIEALQHWSQVRNTLLKGEQNALFISQHGNRLSNRQVANRLQRWTSEQALSQQVNPHKLRHSYATHMLESSGDLRAVQELLGHANLSTTQVYTHLDFQHLAKVYDGAHPRARKKKN